jgi:hypothetical protein
MKEALYAEISATFFRISWSLMDIQSHQSERISSL